MRNPRRELRFCEMPTKLEGMLFIARKLSPGHKQTPARLRIVLHVGFLLMLSTVFSISCRRQPATEKVSPPTPPAPVNQSLPQMPAVIVNKPYPGKGVVTIINLKEGWVEIDHEEIEGLMPAMQMEFWIKDRSLLRNIKVGDKVEFVVVETGKGEFLTEIKKID